jgi:hypothetical protein
MHGPTAFDKGLESTLESAYLGTGRDLSEEIPTERLRKGYFGELLLRAINGQDVALKINRHNAVRQGVQFV